MRRLHQSAFPAPTWPSWLTHTGSGLCVLALSMLQVSSPSQTRLVGRVGLFFSLLLNCNVAMMTARVKQFFPAFVRPLEDDSDSVPLSEQDALSSFSVREVPCLVFIPSGISQQKSCTDDSQLINQTCPEQYIFIMYILVFLCSLTWGGAFYGGTLNVSLLHDRVFYLALFCTIM